MSTPNYPPSFPGPQVSTDLARLLVPTPDGGTSIVIAAYLTAWDAGTGANTVSIGATSYTNLGYINPAGLSIGPVVLLDLPGSPIILGRVYRPTV